MSEYSENTLIEQPTIELFAELKPAMPSGNLSTPAVARWSGTINLKSCWSPGCARRWNAFVDYVGVFRNLQRALAIYGSGAGGEAGEGEKPVEDKAVLVAQLQTALQEATAFCVQHSVNLEIIQSMQGFAKVKCLDDAVEALIGSDADKKRYLALAARLNLLYKAVLPDAVANTLAPDCQLIEVLAKKIRDLTPTADISDVMGQVENLLNRSIKPEGYVIREPAAEEYGTDQRIDLSRIDFEALQEQFARGRKRTEAEKFKSAVN